MRKKNVLVIFGGCSSEYSVSLASTAGVISHIDRDRYEPILVGITKLGDWFYYSGAVARIENDSWFDEVCIAAALSPNRSAHELLIFEQGGIRHIHIDIAFPVLHGKNGEDGTVQGALALAGIPLAGCSVLSSALCMDKERSHKLVGACGVRVPHSFSFSDYFDPTAISEAADKLGYPLFVKPVKAGSSYGIAKVLEPSELMHAVCEAFHFDDRVILEENIEGFEVGCAVMGGKSPFAGELDEIELAEGFFDFTEKYNLLTSKIHVPARIPPEKSAQIKETAKKIYLALGCKSFARVDMFLTPSGEVVFNEVNTIPGFTPHSRFPSMMKAAGMPFEAVITEIIESAEKE